MSFDPDTLYALLPQVYRSRDSSGALKALVRVLAEQAEVLEEDLARLYDNHFIETCEEWAVPYIGALVGTRGLSAIPEQAARHRSEVANTLALRRRKGTAAALEQLASDLLGGLSGYSLESKERAWPTPGTFGSVTTPR